MTDEPKEAKLTEYTVLRERKGVAQIEGQPAQPPVFSVWVEVSATSAAAARQLAFAKLSPDEQRAGATLVAVPSRSWQPKRRVLESKPRSVEV